MPGGEPQELRQHLRGVREIGIHLDHELGRHRERRAESLLVRRADAELRTVVDEVHAGIRGGHLAHQGRRPVRRVVVHHHHVAVGGGEHLRHEPGDVRALDVRRDDDDRPRHGERP